MYFQGSLPLLIPRELMIMTEAEDSALARAISSYARLQLRYSL